MLFELLLTSSVVVLVYRNYTNLVQTADHVDRVAELEDLAIQCGIPQDEMPLESTSQQGE